jgi:hypothetical protein
MRTDTGPLGGQVNVNWDSLSAGFLHRVAAKASRCCWRLGEERNDLPSQGIANPESTESPSLDFEYRMQA